MRPVLYTNNADQARDPYTKLGSPARDPEGRCIHMYEEQKRTPIQVPGQLKAELMELHKDRAFQSCNTQADVIKWLLDYYNKTEEQKQKQIAYQQENMIDIGSETKERFSRLKAEMKFRQDSSVVEILAEHWESSLQMSPAVFNLSRELN